MLHRIGRTAFVLVQYILPQHWLSSLMYQLARTRNRRFTERMIRAFARIYDVNLAEAVHGDPGAYGCFNEFFTRELKADARPLPDAPLVPVSPADGAISQIGPIDGDRLIQAKGVSYTLDALLADPDAAGRYRGGSFVTIYLSPRDYHRLHMPVSGVLREMRYVPGKLFSVNEATASAVPGLFARNERVIAQFDTDCGPMALILVGAIFVGGIETVWHGEVCPSPGPRQVQTWRYGEAELKLERGAEMGRFNLGSTIIVLFGPEAVTWDAGLAPAQPVRLGQALGQLVRNA